MTPQCLLQVEDIPIYQPAMIGMRIDELGTLIRDGGAFYLRRDLGGRYLLELHRVPVDQVEKRVRITGTLVGDALINVDGVASA